MEVEIKKQPYKGFGYCPYVSGINYHIEVKNPVYNLSFCLDERKDKYSYNIKYSSKLSPFSYFYLDYFEILFLGEFISQLDGLGKKLLNIFSTPILIIK